MARVRILGAAALSLALALTLTGCFDDGLKPSVENPASTPRITGRLVFADGSAAAGAELALRAHDSATVSSAGVSKAQGTWTLEAVENRSYDLLALLERGDTTFAAFRRNISFVSGTLEVGTDTLHPTGTLRVRVRDAGDAPLAGVRCGIQGLDQDAVSDADGVCTLTALPQGSFEVVLTRPGMEPATATLTVRAGRIVTTTPVRLNADPGPANDTTLVAHWDFEEKTGNVLRDATGKHHGTFVGNADLRPDGVRGNSLHLDGSNHAVVPRSPAFGALASFTLSAWVWQEIQTLDEPVMEFSRAESLGVHVWLNTPGQAIVSPGRLYVNTFTTAEQDHMLFTPALVTTGRWTHIAYTYDAATRAASLYVNGSLSAQSTVTGTPSKTGDFYLGYRPLDSRSARKGAILRGRIDEVKIWSRALTASEVEQSYETLAPAVPPAPAGALTLLPSADAPTVGTTGTSGLRFNTNLGLAKEFQVGVYDMNTVIKPLIRFSMPGDVPASRITRAVLRVNSTGWIIKNVAPATVTLKLHQVLRDWKEGSGNDVANSASVDGVTARERYWGAAWNMPSIGTDDVDAGSAVVDTATRPRLYNGVWEFEITSLAKAWATNPTLNFGVMLAPYLPAGNPQVEDYPVFPTREGNVADSLKPRLVLELSAP